MEATTHNLSILGRQIERTTCDDNIVEPLPGEDSELLVKGYGTLTPRNVVNELIGLTHELDAMEVAQFSPTKTELILTLAKSLNGFAREMESYDTGIRKNM